MSVVKNLIIKQEDTLSSLCEVSPAETVVKNKRPLKRRNCTTKASKAKRIKKMTGEEIFFAQARELEKIIEQDY